MSEAPIPVELEGFTNVDVDMEMDRGDKDGGKDADDLAALLAKRERAKPNRWTYVLGVCLVLVIGAVVGAWIGRTTAPATGLTLPAGGFSAFRSGAGGAGGAGFPGAGFPGAGFGGPDAAGAGAGAVAGGGSSTSGTVKLIDGQNLYITDGAGATVKVKVGSGATVTTQTPSSLAGISLGATVTVSGSTAPDGTITAKSVTQDSSGPASTSSSGPASDSPAPSTSAQGATK